MDKLNEIEVLIKQKKLDSYRSLILQIVVFIEDIEKKNGKKISYEDMKDYFLNKEQEIKINKPK